LVRRELQKCKPNSIPIIIIDEFDNLKDNDARELTAHVIKSLYDYTVNATIILVGVADDLRELISNHQSLPRTIVQIKLERMKDTELNELLDSRLNRTPILLSGDARWTIVKLSRGLPYYAHILGKHSAQSAVSGKRIVITSSDVAAAMDRLIVDSGQSLEDDYKNATTSNQVDNFFTEVLLSCAIADADESGFFTATSVVDALNNVYKEKKRHAHIQRHMTEFISERRGKILIRRGAARQYRYRFSDPMMQPYVIMKGIRDGHIDSELRSKHTIVEQPTLPNVN
jgi:Cdc6-like AAA superfamily ATPase